MRDRLTEFVRYRHEYLRGDEKGEAQIFSEALFRAFGHAGVRQAGATLEQRIKKALLTFLWVVIMRLPTPPRTIMKSTHRNVRRARDPRSFVRKND